MALKSYFFSSHGIYHDIYDHRPGYQYCNKIKIVDLMRANITTGVKLDNFTAIQPLKQGKDNIYAIS